MTADGPSTTLRVTPRFHEAPRAAIRAARPWNRLAYIQRKLPEAIREGMAELRLDAGTRLLDYGCADAPYRGFVPQHAEYVGADLPGNPQADITLRSDGGVDAGDASFDAVLSTQVLEHVEDPALYLAECLRVLRPGGRLLLTTHGIMVYHPDPDDYWRWTCAGLRRQVLGAGFDIVHLRGVMGLAATGLQLFQDATWSRLPRLLRAPYGLALQSLIALFDRWEPARIRDSNALVFVILAEKPAGVRP